jgi:protein-S-isoprenylcysteine O-methyltransferase Ste14
MMPAMGRVLVLVYGVVVYVAFLAIFVALADFATPIGLVVRSLDHEPTAPLGEALAIDLVLLAAFGVSHSVLARASVKRVVTRVVPVAAERSTYVLVTVLALGLIIWQWRAIPDMVWHVDGPLRVALLAVQAIGVALVIVATFLTDHFDLFGLRQVWLYGRGRAYTPVPFVERSLYRHMRHPMMSGFLLWLWAAPTMTVGHLVFSTGMALYIFVGVALEERGLARELGEPYADYRRRVRAYVPRLRASPRDRNQRPA